jgi:hypothetical protein
MWVSRCPRSHNDCRGDILAKTRMRDAKCRRVGDGRMSNEGFFDLNGRHLFAPAIDQVIQAPVDSQEAVLVEAANVAGSQASVDERS